MIKLKTVSIAVLSLMATFGAARSASADVNTSFRKSYSGGAGGDANSNFGAGYRLDYGFAASKTGGNAKLSADGGTTGWVKLFSKTFDAVTLKANATGAVNTTGTACSANIAYETYLVGIKVPTASGSIAGGKFANKTIISRSQALIPKVSIDLVRIGPAVIGIDVKAAATEYVKINGTAWCNSISAELRPGANITASADVHIDAAVIAAGLRGVLTLMDVSVPATASVGFSWHQESDFFSDGPFCAWNASTSASAKVEVIPVSGKFEPWVRVGLPCTDVLGILPGKGICLNKEWSHVLWSSSAAKSTFTLASVAATPFIGTSTSSCPTNPPAVPNR